MKVNKYGSFAVFAILFGCGIFAESVSAQCRDPWVGQVINELIGRSAIGSGDSGECNTKLYGGGSWSSYDDLRNKVRDSFFNGDAAKKKERCFGAQGSGCDALQFGVYNFKAGRTDIGGGRYRMWMSVGSIKHDNCCLANPNGKMCGGALDASQQVKDNAKSLTSDGNGYCVQEWDKAFWNAYDGKAWTQDYAPWDVPDLTIVTNARSARSRNGIELVKFETQETRKRSAPRGQKLDTGDDQYCASGKAKGYWFGTGTWIICE